MHTHKHPGGWGIYLPVLYFSKKRLLKVLIIYTSKLYAFFSKPFREREGDEGAEIDTPRDKESWDKT